MKEKPIVLYTDHSVNKTLCYYFAKGSNSLMCHVNNFKDFDKTVATYGFRRGTSEILKKVNNFYYIDHGYFNQSKRVFENNKTKIFNLDGYFRIAYNNYWHDGQGNSPDDRLKKLNINFKPLKKAGEYIILSLPSQESISFFKLENWLDRTSNEIRKYTDRKIITHGKNSKIPLDHLLENAWAFVSNHSTAGLKAMIEGVPAYFTDSTLKKISSIVNIENHKIDYKIFNNLAYSQWNIKEIESGEAWENISKLN